MQAVCRKFYKVHVPKTLVDGSFCSDFGLKKRVFNERLKRFPDYLQIVQNHPRINELKKEKALKSAFAIKKIFDQLKPLDFDLIKEMFLKANSSHKFDIYRMKFEAVNHIHKDYFEEATVGKTYRGEEWRP